jgi:glycosyltransferase involved in cell wall biosynthesis
VTVIARRERGRPAGRETWNGHEVVRLPVAPVPVVRAALDVSATVRTVAELAPRPDLLLCFQTFVSGLAGVRASAHTEIPAVVWVRGESEYRLSRGRMRWISPWVWQRARGVLVQSETVRAELLAEISKRSSAKARDELAAKLEVVPNGLDLPSPPLPAGSGVLSVGRLVALKRMDVVLDAAAACGMRVTIVGDGPERTALESRQSAANASFEGAVPRERLAELYRRAGVVVLASTREGFPNVLLEAMAHARPVIATPVGGVRDLVRDGENGLLVPPGDVAALAAALRRVEGDRALASRLGAAARLTAEGFAWDTTRARLEPLLERWGG